MPAALSVPSFLHGVQWDAQCTVTAVLWLLSNGLEIAYQTMYTQHNAASSAALVAMDVVAIADSFQARMDTATLEMTFHLVNILSWIFLSMVLARVAHQLPGGAQSLRVLSTTATQIEVIGSLLFLGLMQSLNWVNLNFNMEEWLPTTTMYNANVQQQGYNYNYPDENRRNLQNSGYMVDGLGWKTLEVLRVALRGMLFWVESVEYILLAAILVILFCSITSSSRLRRWASAGLIVGLVSFLEFLECMRAFRHGRGVMGVLLGCLNHSILVPLWLLWLGHVLTQQKNPPSATPQVLTASVWARECT